MKVLKKVLKYLLIVIVSVVALLWITGNKHILTGIKQTYLIGKSKPDIDDMEYHYLRTIPANAPSPWKESKRLNNFETTSIFEEANKTYQSAAYLVIYKDSVLYEKYYENIEEPIYFNSFSMAKSFLATAIGVAIDEGLIKSLDQKVSDYLPRFKEGKNADLTIKHLIMMSSGIDYGESYTNPFGYQAKAYYGTDLLDLTSNYDVKIEPGTLWKYEGGNSVILGQILEKATGQRVSTYFGEKVWSKIGAEQVAYWKLDHEDGMENTFSAIYSNPRDFARMAKLYMNKGMYAFRPIVSSSFIEESLKPVNIKNPEGEVVNYYGYHWWLSEYEGKKLFACQGMRGQYIICIPEDELIVVRLGHSRSEERVDHFPADRKIWIDQAYEFIVN